MRIIDDAATAENCQAVTAFKHTGFTTAVTMSWPSCNLP